MTTGAPPPDYYAILGTSEKATDQEIRDAYKRPTPTASPPTLPSDRRARKFQLVNDAYYTLSDARRRRDYDIQRKLFSRSHPTRPSDPFEEADEEVPPQAEPHGPNAFSWARNFTGGADAAGADRQQADNAQFSDVFEEMMREEGLAEDGTNRPTSKFWSLLGGLSGGALGFIVANVPGLVAGAVAGNRLGAVRDAKGKSVYRLSGASSKQ